MSDQQHDEFEPLKKLLALKRHEQPPLGYFENFSARVIARLGSPPPERQLSWIRRVFGGAFNSPALAGAYGIGALAVVVLGFALVPTPEEGNGALNPAHHASAYPTSDAPAVVESAAPTSFQPAPSPSTGSLSPVHVPDSAPAGLFNAGGFLNNGQPDMKVERVDFRFPSYTNTEQRAQ